MNEEQKARLARLAAEVGRESFIWPRDGEWLLALVKELEEENARLETSKAEWVKIGGAASWSMAEEQLEAVTAERNAERLAHEISLAAGHSLLVDRDELKREVERLRERTDLAYDTATLHMKHSKNQFAQAVAWRGRAEKAEAERDALRAFVRKAAGETEHAGAPGEWGQEARELARLKDAKGGG